jgi:hypothetical protein
MDTYLDGLRYRRREAAIESFYRLGIGRVN